MGSPFSYLSSSLASSLFAYKLVPVGQTNLRAEEVWRWDEGEMYNEKKTGE